MGSVWGISPEAAADLRRESEALLSDMGGDRFVPVEELKVGDRFVSFTVEPVTAVAVKVRRNSVRVDLGGGVAITYPRGFRVEVVR